MSQSLSSYLLLFLTLVIADSCFAQTTIVRGKVTDNETGEPIPFANVYFIDTKSGAITDIDGNPISEATVTICRQNMERRGMRERGLRVISDEDGLFTFEEVPAGNIMIQAVARGYMRAVQRIEIVADEATRVRIELSERRGGGH